MSVRDFQTKVVTCSIVESDVCLMSTLLLRLMAPCVACAQLGVSACNARNLVVNMPDKQRRCKLLRAGAAVLPGGLELRVPQRDHLLQ